MGNLLHLYFNPTGRIGRATWWLNIIILEFVLSALLIGLAVISVASIGATHVRWTANFAAFTHVVLIAVGFWCSIALSIKRLHDREYSAWVMFVVLVPFAGGLAMLVILGFLRGTEGANRYGI